MASSHRVKPFQTEPIYRISINEWQISENKIIKMRKTVQCTWTEWVVKIWPFLFAFLQVNWSLFPYFWSLSLFFLRLLQKNWKRLFFIGLFPKKKEIIFWNGHTMRIISINCSQMPRNVRSCAVCCRHHSHEPTTVCFVFWFFLRFVYELSIFAYNS